MPLGWKILVYSFQHILQNVLKVKNHSFIKPDTVLTINKTKFIVSDTSNFIKLTDYSTLHVSLKHL